MPGYGKQTAAAGRAFWLSACADMTRVHREYRQGSLLASNFNQLWCGALNFASEGRQVDYFAMLHDDIGPEEYWLDHLIDEMEANDLDVLGVAVPIKDPRGLTSLALDRPGDTWMAAGRLSMHDIYQLPETFTSEDIGAPLLLNTGCWVCRFDMTWAPFVHFEINDRIVYNTALSRYQSQTEPEDWFFSRLLHEIGQGETSHLRPLRIGATRKIAVAHRGECDCTNTCAWGSNIFDTEYRATSPVPGAFPAEIRGWLLPSEGKRLAELAAGKRVLEIGSYCGLSTVCIGRTAKHVTALDYFDGRGTPEPRDTLGEFTKNLSRYGIADKVEIESDPSSYFPVADSKDLVFIDGAHDYESVVDDIAIARESLAPGGLIVLHDYKHPSHPGVTEAVDELLDEGGALISIHDTLAVVRPPARIPLEV